MATSFGVTIEAPGMHEYWQTVIDHAPKIVRQEMLEALQDNGDTVRKQARANLLANRSIDTKALYGSLSVRFPARNKLWATVGSTLRYARTVEDGRRPGSPPPPYGSLRGWMRRKNFIGSEHVLRMSISRKGIKPKPYLLPALKSTQSEQKRRWRRCVVNIGKRVFIHRRRYA